MSNAKSAALEDSILGLIFQGVAITGIADNTATSPSTALVFALHTADPGETGNQGTNECSYTSYARVSVQRSTAGFVLSAGVIKPAASIDFPEATGGSETATYVSVSQSTNSTADLLYYGALSTNIAIASGVTPRLSTNTSIAET